MGRSSGWHPTPCWWTSAATSTAGPGLLLSFAVLGAAFAHTYMGIENPRIGLLSVGAEEAKGNRQVQESYQMFLQSQSI